MAKRAKKTTSKKTAKKKATKSTAKKAKAKAKPKAKPKPKPKAKPAAKAAAKPAAKPAPKPAAAPTPTPTPAPAAAAPKARREKVLDDLSVGSHVFYPLHGVASVTGVEKREFGGATQEFYVLDLERGGKALLPTNNVEAAGVRDLVSATKARELMRRVKIEPKIDDSSWKERATAYNDALRSGSADRYTEILQELLFRSKEDKLSTSEQRMLDTARSYFVGEISVVLEKPADRLEEDLMSIATP